MTKLDFGLRHDLPHTRWDFIVNKLQTPRMYDEGLFKLYDDMLRMPHFAMNQQDAEKIATFVMGHKTGKTAKRYLYKDTDANYRKRPWELEAQALKLNLGQRPPEAWSGTDRAAFAGMVERLTKATKARQETADADRLKKIGSSLAGLKPKNLSREDAQFVLGVQGRIEGRLAPQWLDASARRRAIIEGRKLILQFNCQGCHLIEGRGWELRDYMAKYPYPGLKKTDVNEASPPFLSQLRSESDYQARWRNFQGARTKAGWLFNFLRDPGSTIIGRPWLRVKMPNFHMTVQQANTLTRYFAALNGTAWPNAANDVPPSDEDYKIALSVFEKNDCFGCHRATPTPAPGKKGAPDLERAEARLRADWVQHWIYKPYQFIPFTAMPSGQIPSMEDAAAVTRVIMNRAAMRRLKTQFKIPLIK